MFDFFSGVAGWGGGGRRGVGEWGAWGVREGGGGLGGGGGGGVEANTFPPTTIALPSAAPHDSMIPEHRITDDSLLMHDS